MSTTLINIAEFIPDLEPELPNCPLPIIERRLIEAIIDACERANLWRVETSAALVANRLEYTFGDLPEHTRPHSLLSLKRGEHPLVHRRDYELWDRGCITLAHEPKDVFVDAATAVGPAPVDPAVTNPVDIAPGGYYIGATRADTGGGNWVTPTHTDGTTGERQLNGLVIDLLWPEGVTATSTSAITVNRSAFEEAVASGLGDFDAVRYDNSTEGVRYSELVPGESVLRIRVNDSGVGPGGLNTQGIRLVALDAYSAGPTADEIAAFDAALDAYEAEAQAAQAESSLNAIITLKPTREVREVSSVLFDDYHELIVTGALSRAWGMVNRDWTNIEMSMEYRRRFETRLAHARQAIDREFVTRSTRIHMRRFALSTQRRF